MKFCKYRRSWFLYVPPALTFRKYIFLRCECFVWFSKSTSNSVCSTDRLLLIMKNTSVYCEVGTEVLYIYVFNLDLRGLKEVYVSNLSSSPQFQSWIGFILLFGWHSISVLEDIIPQVADRHSGRYVQRTCIHLLRLSRTTLWTELCCRKGRKTGVSPAAPEEASHIPSAKDATVHSSPRTPFTAPFSSSLLKCIHSLYPIIPLSSIITFEQTTERIFRVVWKLVHELLVSFNFYHMADGDGRR